MENVDWDFLSYLPQLDDTDIENLYRLVSTEEIEDVINKINLDKAPKLEGFNVLFFKEVNLLKLMLLEPLNLFLGMGEFFTR